MNLSEWIEYIDSIPVEELQSKVEAANSIEFVRKVMDEDGLDAESVDLLFQAFATRLMEAGLPMGVDGYLDLAELLS